ncbi:MAG: pyridoxal 5'-phosphate synthase lyase subunit PdxS, partial [SAR324 cluster bacterium]|nr:pyridoxal 5'-phosphate synthase lyase subunit PdxS [SAR324 cluster bacterium]
PANRAQAIVGAATYFDDAAKLAELSAGLKSAMAGLEMSEIPPEERLQERGW